MSKELERLREKRALKTTQKLRLSKLGVKNPMFGRVPWNKDKPHLINELNPAWKGWKGDNLTKESLHSWVRNHFVRMNICEHCKIKTKTDWSNKDHKYNSRRRDTWQEICRSCHFKWDYKYLDRTRTRHPRNI